MKEVIKIIVLPILFIIGLLIYLISGKTLNYGYAGFRYLFVLTNGRSNDLVSVIISLFRPKYSSQMVNGVLGELDRKEVKKIASLVQENGFHIFEMKLSEKQIEDILDFAETTEVSYLRSEKKHITYSKKRVLFDEKAPVSARYQFTIEQLMQNQTIQQLIFDNSIRAVANMYLNTKPVLDIVTMWWSVPFNSASEDRAAQKFHFDMDRIAFIKFFFYVTDVDEKNGPHCYVRNSHKRIPFQIRRDRRIDDEEIGRFYAIENVLEICGKRGTIIAVDTRGLHKGKPLLEGKRLLFQIQFSNSLFGQTYSKTKDVRVNDKYKKVKDDYPETYRLIG